MAAALPLFAGKPAPTGSAPPVECADCALRFPLSEAPLSYVRPFFRPAAPDARAQFLDLLNTALQGNTLVKLVLARHVGADQTLQRIIAKPLQVKGQACLSLVYRHQTRDITRNLALEQAQALVAELLPGSFRNAHLFDADGEVQLTFSKKGKPMLQRHGAQAPREAADSSGHDREKNATWSCRDRSCAIWA